MATRCYKNIPKDDASKGGGKDVNKKNSGDAKDKGITEVQPKMKQVYRPKAIDVSLSNAFKTLEKDLLNSNKSINDNGDGVEGVLLLLLVIVISKRDKKDFKIKKGDKNEFKIKKMFENIFKIT